jgi:alpha-tubulin suppressor-like RCC1 family protein
MRRVIWPALLIAAISCSKSLDLFSARNAADSAADGDAAQTTTPAAGLPGCDACTADGLCIGARCVPRASLATLAAGDQHVCAVQAGLLSCWGSNASSQLGVGDSAQRRMPQQVGSADDWFDVAAGDRHSCGLRAPGKLYCWGDNSHGQLGTAGTRSRSVPVRVGRLDDFSAVACGGDNCCARRSAGELLCWGGNANGNVGVGSASTLVNSPTRIAADATFSQVRVAVAHSCAIRSDSALFCWGHNAAGELGLGSSRTDRTQPTRVGTASDWSSIAVGRTQSCGIRNGELLCWGGNDYAQVGIGREGPDAVPLVIDEPARVVTTFDWVEVATGANHTCARKAGTASPLYCRGRGDAGQLGTGVQDVGDMPKLVPRGAGFRSLALGGAFSCALDAEHAVYCWGDNSQGQLGQGDTLLREQPTLVES